MASLYDYFTRDFAQDLKVHRTWKLARADGSPIGEVVARLHINFDANAKYVSFYVPQSDEVNCPEALLLNNIQEILDQWLQDFHVLAGFGTEKTDAADAIYTGRAYFYSEREISEELRPQLTAQAKGLGHNLVFRSVKYVVERNKWETPLAFISHDSRDKAEIAEPLAIQLQKFACPVWYDEFSLRVGDSLRESIETGLKNCKKCIFILTPNFLANGGWSKREYDAIFTREIVEKQNLILPVWHGVTSADVFEYSPILADRKALSWEKGVEHVARNLMHAID